MQVLFSCNFKSIKSTTLQDQAKILRFQRSIEVDDTTNTWNPTTARINSTTVTLRSSLSSNNRESSLRLNPTAINLASTGNFSVNVKGKIGLTSTSSEDDLSLETPNDLTITCGTSNGVVKISDKNTSGKSVDLNNYPINWSALKGVPFKGGITMNDGSQPLIVNTIFGYYLDTSSGSNLVWIYPAFACYYGDSSGAHIVFGAAFYVNSNGVITKITNSNNFITL